MARKRILKLSRRTLSSQDKLEQLLQERHRSLFLDDLQEILVHVQKGKELSSAVELADLADDEIDPEKQAAELAAIRHALDFLSGLDTDAKIDEAYAGLLLKEEQRETMAARQRLHDEIEQLAAEFDAWNLREGWTPREAAALALGIDPDKLHGGVKKVRLEPELDRLLNEVIDRITRSTLKTVGLQKTHIEPKAFRFWAQANLSDLISQLPRSSWVFAASRDPEKSTVTVNKLYSVLLGLSVAKYGLDPNYNPANAASGVPGKISSDLKEVGVDISERSIREYLKTAIDLAREKSVTIKKPKVRPS